jgi:chromosomal replication initiation ATPase DnaA
MSVEVNEIKSMLKSAGIAYTDRVLQNITKLACAIDTVFGCTLNDLKSQKRGENLSYARRVWFWYLKYISFENSAKKLAKTINKHHSLISYDLRMFENDMKYNKKFERFIKLVNVHIAKET